MSLYDMELALVARRFSAETRQWMKLTIRLFDERKNGFGCAPETWREVRGRGWYATRNGWTSLTEKGRREIPALL